MKKISSMNNSLYRLELVSGNKLQKKILPSAIMLESYLILPVWFPLPSPFPLSPARPGGADIASP